MRWKGCIALCLVVLAGLVSASGQEPATLNLHQWGAVTLFHGLPSDHVRAIAQDVDGALWFGTDGGLARYDGRRTQTVVSDRIRGLQLDDRGVLWVATDAGAGRLVGEKIEPIAETTGHPIVGIVALGPERMAMASEQGTIFLCSSKPDGTISVDVLSPERTPSLQSPDGPLPLTSIAAANGVLFVGTRGRGVLTVVGQDVRELALKPRPYFVESLVAKDGGSLWIGAQARDDDSGLYDCFDLQHPRRIGGGLGTISALTFDAGGDLWVGTVARGAERLRDAGEVERHTFEGSAGGLRSNHIYTIFCDREGVVWFGTDRGVCRYDPRSPRVELISPNAQGNFARAMLESSDGRVWCGTNKGLFVRESETAPWGVIPEMDSRTVYALAEVRPGRVLAGGASGLYEIDTNPPGGGYRVSRLEESGVSGGIRSVCVFQGAVYVANFGRGVERVDSDRRTLVWPEDGADARLRDVVSLGAGPDRLWIGTAQMGPFVFDGDQTTRLPELQALDSSAVWAVCENRSGEVWFGTGQGLFLLSAKALSAVIEGVEVRCVTAGLVPGTVWCGTAENGIARVAVDPLYGPIVGKLDTEHGLPSDAVFSLALAPGRRERELLWIGTNRGTARYEPAPTAAVLQITRALGRRQYDAGELLGGLVLEYPQNSLVIDVAATSSRTFPEQFQYAFVVVDGSGQEIAKRVAHDSQIVLENLRPGRYHIDARAFTNDLVASAPLVFEFEVGNAPFPWGTAALSCLLALSLIALWWGTWQNKRLAFTNRLLAETRLQLATETESERRRIARDLHDQTLADLRRLLMLADASPSEVGSIARMETAATVLDAKTLRREIQSISTEIRRICEDLSPSVLSNVGLSAALEWALVDAVAHLPAERKFEYAFSCDPDLDEQLDFDQNVEIQIYRIVQEAVSNVCHHAAARHVVLNASVVADAVQVDVEDDGEGFDPAVTTNRTGRGLGNIRSRASLIDATVSWRARQGGGTVFRLRVPLTRHEPQN